MLLLIMFYFVVWCLGISAMEGAPIRPSLQSVMVGSIIAMHNAEWKPWWQSGNQQCQVFDCCPSSVGKLWQVMASW